jgi:cytochrome c oxidase subunit 4
MPPQEQAELWMALRDRMKNDWHDLTLQERKAAYFISFGPHGPRATPPPGQIWRMLKHTAIAVVGSCIVLALIRTQAGPAPSSMNKEWQEATNEYLKKQRVEPITGISSEGYKGKGYVQSPSKKD